MGAKILVVDDSRTARAVVCQWLSESLVAGLTVREVSSGREAVAVCESESFDLVFLDLTMPDLSGFEVLQLLRDKGVDVSRFVVVSGDVQPLARQRVLALGASAFLAKPLEKKGLLALVKHRLSP